MEELESLNEMIEKALRRKLQIYNDNNDSFLNDYLDLLKVSIEEKIVSNYRKFKYLKSKLRELIANNFDSWYKSSGTEFEVNKIIDLCSLLFLLFQKLQEK